MTDERLIITQVDVEKTKQELLETLLKIAITKPELRDEVVPQIAKLRKLSEDEVRKEIKRAAGELIAPTPEKHEGSTLLADFLTKSGAKIDEQTMLLAMTLDPAVKASTKDFYDNLAAYNNSLKDLDKEPPITMKELKAKGDSLRDAVKSNLERFVNSARLKNVNITDDLVSETVKSLGKQYSEHKKQPVTATSLPEPQKELTGAKTLVA